METQDKKQLEKEITVDNILKKTEGGTISGKKPASEYLDERPLLVRWVMKGSGGLIKTEKHANYVLAGLILIVIAISAYLFYISGRSPEISMEKIVPAMK